MNLGLIQGGHIWAKDRQYSSCLWILWTKNAKTLIQSTWNHRVMHGTSRQRETSKHGALGWYQTCSKERIKVLSDAIERHHPLHTLPAYCIPKTIVMESEDIIYEKVHASPRPLPKISFKDNWMKELDSEVAGGSEEPQQIQPKTPNPIDVTWRPVTTEQTSRSSVQEIDTRFSLGCESTNVSVERSDEDKDADESVDADRVGTGRPVVHTARGKRHWLQSVWIATCSCETSRKLPCSRTLQEDRESSSSTSTSSRFATKKNADNPVSEESKSDDSWNGQCRVVPSYAKQFEKCNAQNALLESRNDLSHLWISLERKWNQP